MPLPSVGTPGLEGSTGPVGPGFEGVGVVPESAEVESSSLVEVSTVRSAEVASVDPVVGMETSAATGGTTTPDRFSLRSRDSRAYRVLRRRRILQVPVHLAEVDSPLGLIFWKINLPLAHCLLR